MRRICPGATDASTAFAPRCCEHAIDRVLVPVARKARRYERIVVGPDRTIVIRHGLMPSTAAARVKFIHGGGLLHFKRFDAVLVDRM
jgi:hypothetical protein